MDIDPKDYRPKFINLHPATKEDKKPRNCIICARSLPSYYKFYCRGECIREAMDKGIYGHEDDAMR